VRAPNDQFITAIAERIRTILARQPACTAKHLADILEIAPERLETLTRDGNCSIDVDFLIDVITAFVREFAVDPQWLLTGKCDGAIHRQALLLGENRTSAGARDLRDFVGKQYQQLRSPSHHFRWSGLFGPHA
jgi:hypothetical protein